MKSKLPLRKHAPLKNRKQTMDTNIILTGLRMGLKLKITRIISIPDTLFAFK